MYRGGRVKGRVPLDASTRRRPRRGAERAAARRPRRAEAAPAARWIALGLVAPARPARRVGRPRATSSFASGVDEANERLPAGRQGASSPTRDGLLLSTPTTILVIGTDGGDARRAARTRTARTRSCSSAPIPEKHRIAYLSIPRDLRVEIPGYGSTKINAANQIGGPALDARDGQGAHRASDQPRRRRRLRRVQGADRRARRHRRRRAEARSSRTSSTARTRPRRSAPTGRAGASRRATQHMDGRRALVYSRIRTNQLDPSDTDITARRRGSRSSPTRSATRSRASGRSCACRSSATTLAAPLATDLSAWELAQLGWVRLPRGLERLLRCRLGGEPATIGGESVHPRDARTTSSVISMWLGPLGAAAAAEGDALRRRLPRR